MFRGSTSVIRTVTIQQQFQYMYMHVKWLDTHDTVPGAIPV